MAEDRMGLPDTLRKGEEPAEDPLRQIVRWAVQELMEAEVAALRRSVQRGCPFGGGAWVAQTAAHLGLESSLRPGGRPRKTGQADDGQPGLFSEKQR